MHTVHTVELLHVLQFVEQSLSDCEIQHKQHKRSIYLGMYWLRHKCQLDKNSGIEIGRGDMDLHTQYIQRR